MNPNDIGVHYILANTYKHSSDYSFQLLAKHHFDRIRQLADKTDRSTMIFVNEIFSIETSPYQISIGDNIVQALNATLDAYARGVVDIDPQRADSHGKLVIDYLDRIVLDEQLATDIETKLERAIKNNHKCSSLKLALAKLMENFFQDDAIAEKNYIDATNDAPNCYICAQMYGRFLWNKRRISDALRQFQRAVGIKPDCKDAHIALIALYQEMQDVNLVNQHLTIHQQLMHKEESPSKKLKKR